MVKDDPGCTDATASFHFLAKFQLNFLAPGFFQMIKTKDSEQCVS